MKNATLVFPSLSRDRGEGEGKGRVLCQEETEPGLREGAAGEWEEAGGVAREPGGWEGPEPEPARQENVYVRNAGHPSLTKSVCRVIR